MRPQRSSPCPPLAPPALWSQADRKRQEDEAAASHSGRDEAMENLLREVDAEFMLTIKDAEEKENKK
jgi:hypothetical protein